MGTLLEKHNALKEVTDAAHIHSERMLETLDDRFASESFTALRREYVSRLKVAIEEAKAIKLDETLKVQERVSDLSLEAAVDLLHAVEDHIRTLRRYNRSELS